MIFSIMGKLGMFFCIVSGLFVSFCNASDWKVYPMFVEGIENMVNMEEKLYFLSGTSLYEYDKGSTLFNVLNRRNKLNDNIVSDIYFNPDKKWVVICYESSNIDVLYEDGTVVNVPGFKDLQIASSKKINDITFNENKAYVATDFGYAVYDGDKGIISQSVVLYKKVMSIVAIGSSMWLSLDDGLYHVPDDGHANAIIPTSTSNIKGQLRKIGESSFFVAGDKALWRINVDEDMSIISTCLSEGQAEAPEHEYDGGFKSVLRKGDETFLVMLDDKGDLLSMIQLPNEMRNSNISIKDTDGVRWEACDKGIRKISIINENDVAIESDYVCPEAVSMKIVGNLLMDDKSKRLLVMTSGPSNLTAEYGQPGYINVVCNGTISNITPVNVPDEDSTGHLRDINSPVFDPDDASILYFGTWYDGVYKVKDDEIAMKYDQYNSPLELSANWYCLVPAVQFDKKRNLWIMQTDINSNGNFYVLPQEKRLLEEVSVSDWIIPQVDAINDIDHRMKFIITKRDDIKIFTNGLWNSYLRLLDDKGNPAGEISEKKYVRLRDRNGKDVSWNYIYCFYEDTMGNVWTGTDNGVFYFNPLEAFSTEFKVTQPMVCGDILLAGEKVTCINSDIKGRKWFGTEMSGIYVANESGEEILEHFDTFNSLLPDNKILTMSQGVNGNIFVGTNYGLVEVAFDVCASRDDNLKVSVYPEILYPENLSGVVIGNLKKNSHIVITNADDETVAELTNVGGSVVWNTCGLDGKFVRTGEYSVWVNESNDIHKIGSVKIIR